MELTSLDLLEDLIDFFPWISKGSKEPCQSNLIPYIGVSYQPPLPSID